MSTEANSAATAQAVTIAIDATQSVSGLLQAPAAAHACYVLAHGAGAGMTHAFMAAVAIGLAERGIASLRYQFPSMERGSKRPDPPATAHAAVRAAVGAASRLLPGMALVAGGKSFGGRMTSQAQALDPLPDVRGLAFLGFPLHPPKQPGDARAEHLAEVRIPLLFLQGTADALADPAWLRPCVERLRARATLIEFAHADHSFHVPARSGTNDETVLAALLDALAGWIESVK